MLRSIVVNEWRTLARNAALWSAIAILGALVLIGAYNGARAVDLQQERQTELVAEEAERLDQARRSLRESTRGNAPLARRDPRNAADMAATFGASHALLPHAPLAALSTGQSDLMPGRYKVGLDTNPALAAAEELENPTNLLTGNLDVAFVIVFLYPLVILALSYDLLSADKERGALALALAQPVALSTLVAGKVLARGAIVVTLTAALTLAGAAAAGVRLSAPDALAALAAYFGVACIYALFWFSVAVLVNALGLHSASNAVVLAGVWVLLVLVVPSAVGIAASARYPIPSRIEMVQAMRVASRETSEQASQSMAEIFADHPEMAAMGSLDMEDYHSRRVFLDEEVRRRIEPVVERFEQSVVEQQGLVERFKYVSPAVLTLQGLNEVSGTSYSRYRRFQSEVERFVEEWREHFLPLIFAKKTFQEADLDALPRFEMSPESAGNQAPHIFASVLPILLVSLALALAARLRLRKYSIVG